MIFGPINWFLGDFRSNRTILEIRFFRFFWFFLKWLTLNACLIQSKGKIKRWFRIFGPFCHTTSFSGIKMGQIIKKIKKFKKNFFSPKPPIKSAHFEVKKGYFWWILTFECRWSKWSTFIKGRFRPKDIIFS